MNFNPIRRSPLKPKPRNTKAPAPWHAPRVRLDSTGMARLRSEAFARSGGICECGREECQKLPERLRRVTWYDGHLHHIVSRARGGSDEISNVAFVKRECHYILTGTLQWTGFRKAKELED